MLSSISNFERPVPPQRWRRMAALTAGCVLLFVVAWEGHWRSKGYRPTLNDSEGLWAFQRERLGQSKVVIIGDSRTRFDLDLDTWARVTGGERPLLLGINGSCARPVLSDLAADQSFAGTVVCNVTEGLFYAPGGPPLGRAEERLRYFQKRTVSQVASDYLAMGLERQLVFLQKEDLSLSALLGQLPLSDRPGARVPPALPPHMGIVSADNRTMMLERLERDETMKQHIQKVWLGLLALSPPLEPQLREKLIADVKKDVDRIRGRGGRVLFLRLPSTGKYLEIEKQKWPRKDYWDRLLEVTGCSGFHFEDDEQLRSYDCPEWSHLTARDAVRFTERLINVMRNAGVTFQ